MSALPASSFGGPIFTRWLGVIIEDPPPAVHSLTGLGPGEWLRRFPLAMQRHRGHLPAPSTVQNFRQHLLYPGTIRTGASF